VVELLFSSSALVSIKHPRSPNRITMTSGLESYSP
jgi:hypothetical protein